MALIMVAGLTLSIEGRTVSAEPPQPTVVKSVKATDECRQYQVTLSVTGESSPKNVDVMLVIDISTSMTGSPLASAKDAAKSFIDKLGVNDRVGLVYFSDSAHLGSGLTLNHQNVKDAIDKLEVYGYTNTAAGIQRATQELDVNGRSNAVKALIVFSDGLANRSTVSSSSCGSWPCMSTPCTEDAINKAGIAKDEGYTVFSVFLRNITDHDAGCTISGVELLGENTMKEIASGSEKPYFYTTANPDDLVSIYTEIAGSLSPAFTDVRVADAIADCFGNASTANLGPDANPTQGTAYYDAGNHTIYWDVGSLGNWTATLVYNVTAGLDCSNDTPVKINKSVIVDYRYDDGPSSSVAIETNNDYVTLPPPPIADAGVDETVYVGGTIQLTGKPDGMAAYRWEGPDGWSSTDQNPTRSPASTGMSGTYTLTVTNSNHCIDSDTVEVTVVGYSPSILTSLVVTPENASVVIGGTEQFTATGYYSSGSSADLTGLASWTSSDNGVATVSSGLATGVAVGNASITAAYGGMNGSATLNVTSGHTLLSISVTPETASIALGQSQQFEAWALYADSGLVNITDIADWTSGNITVATISAGNATGVGVGTTGITAEYGNVTSNTATLTVGPAVITGITVNTGGSVEVCGTKQITATATYTDGSSKDVTSEVTWSSSDSGIATIDATGLATGIAVGNVTITAALGGVSGSATLSVTPSEIVSLVLTPVSASILVNGKQQFTAMVTYSNGNSTDVTSKANWASSQENVATVVAGLASAKAAGTTDITATFCNVTSNLATLTVSVGVPWSLIGGIIGGLLALGLLLFFLLRRRRREEPEEE